MPRVKTPVTSNPSFRATSDPPVSAGMARRRRHQEQEHHERWLVSYADFITLLFAFFVVMYSISSVNEGKYRVLSSTLTGAFVTPAQSMDPIQIGEQVRTQMPVSGEYAAPDARPDNPNPHPIIETVQDETPPVTAPVTGKPLAAVEQELTESLSGFIDKDLVSVNRTERGIEVEMKSKMLFSSGSARLSRDALGVLKGVAQIIKPLPNQIRVEGHTDNVPIKTVTFPSNWELSAARAASVVHLFTRFDVNSSRMAAIGFGEFRPIATNEQEEGRQKNRRVAMVIMAGEHERMLGSISESGDN